MLQDWIIWTNWISIHQTLMVSSHPKPNWAIVDIVSFPSCLNVPIYFTTDVRFRLWSMVARTTRVLSKTWLTIQSNWDRSWCHPFNVVSLSGSWTPQGQAQHPMDVEKELRVFVLSNGCLEGFAAGPSLKLVQVFEGNIELNSNVRDRLHLPAECDTLPGTSLSLVSNGPTTYVRSRSYEIYCPLKTVTPCA